MSPATAVSKAVSLLAAARFFGAAAAAAAVGVGGFCGVLVVKWRHLDPIARLLLAAAAAAAAVRVLVVVVDAAREMATPLAQQRARVAIIVGVV